MRFQVTSFDKTEETMIRMAGGTLLLLRHPDNDRYITPGGGMELE